MKKTLLTLLLALTTLQALTQNAFDDEAAIRAVMSTQEADWNRGDVEAFMQGYWHSDSLSFISSRGVNRGWQATLDGYKKGYPDRETMGTLTFTLQSVNLLCPESAFVVGQWHLARKKGDVGGYFTLLWRKIGGRWLIVADHTS